ncbi:MAG TPA: hypothetical protein EYG35_00765 [Gammaproteobacteria bacterium]|nr:hypothetical protein [Gammaproteobacteria bacterium]
MEKKSILVSILLGVALIFVYFFYNNQIDNTQSEHSEQLASIESQYNQQIKDLKGSHEGSVSSHLETIHDLQKSLKEANSDVLDTNTTSTNYKKEQVSFIKELQNNVKGQDSFIKELQNNVKGQDSFIKELQNNVFELTKKLNQKNDEIDSLKFSYDTEKTSAMSCPETEPMMQPSSCGNIDEVEIQLIEKNSQLNKVKRELSMERIKVSVLKDEKVRANEALSLVKSLQSSLLSVESELKSTQNNLDLSISKQTNLNKRINKERNASNALKSKTKVLNNEITLIKNELFATGNQLTSALTENEFKIFELSQALGKINLTTDKLKLTERNLHAAEAKLQLTERNLHAAEANLKLTEEHLSSIRETISKQNKIIITNSIDRIRKSEDGLGIRYSVYLAGFTEEEINNYCLDIMNQTNQDIEAFGIITSTDKDAQSIYRELCVNTDSD